ncbi:VOC family protein [Microbacterium hydrocarbonoxydans]|uniref:VOC family protein n=1 Tax=Microbacterium hydrocarbonoxydans TaxID=273678 RepID=UPI00203E1DFA|nr:VOC family protein [Microbacterium hydrocarbonoxydans]MCM3781172.1 VOC family protein [Microbacterium hydrocarbonoxydans]
MALLDHLGITVDDLERGRTQFHPVLTALGYVSGGEDGHSISWNNGDETEIILYVWDENSEPHRHGRIGWQHIAFAVDSRDEVDRLHDIAKDAGWTVVREPKEYPRYSARYYASFVEDADGIRIEFMHNPPRES